MESKIRSYTLCALVLMGLAIGGAQADLPEIQSRSNLSCMMGGIGADETEAMRLEAKNGHLISSLLSNKAKPIHGYQVRSFRSLTKLGK